MTVASDILARALAWVAGRQEPAPAPMTEDEAMSLILGLLMRFEGLYLKPYLCPAGVPTIGLGSTYYLDGRPVTLKDPPITREHAIVLAKEMIRREYMPAVLRLCRGLDTPGRVAAITDFAYNLGTGALAGSTLRKRINEGRWEDVPRELMKWVFAAGKRLRGLVLRREAEAALI